MAQTAVRDVDRSRNDAVAASRTWVRIDAPLLIASAITLVALAVRLFRLDGESLWFDEGYTLIFSHMPLGRLLLVSGTHEHPPLYYLLTHYAFQFDDSYLVARAMVAVAGALSVFVLYRLGARLFGPAVGLIAAALLAISPVHLWNSQDARAYELTGLLVLLSYLVLFTNFDRPRARGWIAYAILACLALYTDYTAAFVLLPQALFLVRARQLGVTRWLVGAWAGIVLAYLPWIGMLASDAARVAQDYWIGPPTLEAVSGTVLEFLGFVTPCPTGTRCVSRPAPVPLLPGHEIAIAAIAVLAVVAAAIYVVRARRLSLAVVMLWLAAPFVILLAISIVRPLFLDRYVLGSTYPLYLLLALGVTSAWKHRRIFLIAISVVAVIASIDAYNVRYVLANPTNPDWKTPMRDFQAVYRPGDSVAYYPGVVKAIIQPYLRPGWEPAMERPIWLHTYIDIPRWEQSKGTWTDDQLRNSALKTLVKGRDRMWIVAQTYVGIWNLWNFFTLRHWNLILNQEYTGNTFVELWTKGRPSALGPAAAPVDEFGAGWRFTGDVTVQGQIARTFGQATLTRTFRVKPQTLYAVNTAHRQSIWPEPRVQVLVYRACATQSDGTLTGVGKPIGTYPQIEHFDLWTTAHWYMKPFGFITPPGAGCAVMTFQTFRGVSRWRNIGVYEQR